MMIGLEKKKKARVMWKSDNEVRMVFAEISAMVSGSAPASSSGQYNV